MENALPQISMPPRPFSSAVTRFLSMWFPPHFVGLDNINPDAPALFVGNHTTYGMLDIPLFQAGVYNHSGVWLRGLADHAHYRIKPWSRILEKHGAIRGTRELCSLAMTEGENIMVFPGGGREVMKRRGEEYTLIWKRRLGFVKLATQHHYPIQPFASVGADDVWDILLDSGFWNRKIPAWTLKTSGLWEMSRQGQEVPPLVRGIGPSILPRPEPFFFALGEPISTEEFWGLENDDEAMIVLRDRVADSVYSLITVAKEARQNAPALPLWRRALRRF